MSTKDYFYCDPVEHEVAIIGAGAGTVAAGVQQRYLLFIENCHIHARKITQAITGYWLDKLAAIPARSYALPVEKIQANQVLELENRDWRL